VSGDAARPVDERLYPTFAAFVDAHRTEIEDLVASRSTQTNEARRTVSTLPALGLVAAADGRPLALLEVGASAGLNLMLDRFGFRIGSAAVGDPASPVQLECAVEGDLRPPVPSTLPIAWRLGVDLSPLDVRDPGTRAWLRALIWPEHRDRLELLDAALGLARPDPPPLVRGDLARDVPPLVTGAPPQAVVAVTSTWVLAYVSAEGRQAFVSSLRGAARARGEPVWLVTVEAQSVLATLGLDLVAHPGDGYGPSMLALCRFDPDAGHECRLLAECHPHGRWIRWLDRASAVAASASA
jgi:hypothetical protein